MNSIKLALAEAIILISSCVKTATNIEDSYVVPKDPIVSQSSYVVITGCSGGGKSTLLNELCQRGHFCVPEPGRQIVKEQMSIDGDGLPWMDQLKFTNLALSRYLYTFNMEKPKSDFVFFDRGIPDAISYFQYLHKPLPAYLHNAGNKFRYQQKVFMTPPWKEIYKNDDERKHSFEEAVEVYNVLIKTYEEYGYKVIIVPKINVKDRVDFILDHLNSRNR